MNIPKPPIGIMPEHMFLEQRSIELVKTIARHLEAEVKVNDAWWNELERILPKTRLGKEGK